MAVLYRMVLRVELAPICIHLVPKVTMANNEVLTDLIEYPWQQPQGTGQNRKGLCEHSAVDSGFGLINV